MRVTRIISIGILMPLVSSAATCSLSGAWEFRKTLDENTNAVKEAWHEVRVPHDWAIEGPFAPDLKDGWTGALPWRGAGEYRRTFSLTDEDRDNLHMDGRAYLEFDGVMGRSEVFLNGQKVGGGTYGYLGYKLDVTKCVKPEGNELLVRATTLQQRSRWYPGGGIFRDVRLRVCPHPHPLPDTLAIRVERLTDDRAEMVATYETPWGPETKRWTVEKPRRWSIEDPYRYELDIYGFKFPYGIREAKFDAEKGFFLNGKRVQLKGVDLHADLGPLGMAFDLGAMKRQLLAMKAMGVNAIRTSHNCPAPQLLDLCDEMGFVVWDECFDKWNGYAGRLPEEKLEDYVTDHLKRFVRRDRNHPCVVVWSIGNEINAASEKNPDGVTRERCRLFREAVRSEDATRPVGIGECDDTLPERGWLDDLDITGWNYARKYAKMKAHAPQKPVLYTESASAVSSFGDTSLPLPEWRTDYRRMTRTCSAYDRHSAWWSDIPDYEFWRMENDRSCGGEFVWTGIDYLGEPTPHDSARSSYFGVCDLCVIPKDRFYLYRAHWLPEETTCHLVPNHWNFRAGEKVPVYLYTNGDEAELFLNGRSLGRRTKSARTDYPLDLAYPNEPGKGWLKPHQMTADVSNQLVTAYYDVCDRYRIRWDAIPYEPGELKAVAYRNGKKLAEETVRTCGAAVALKISADPFQPDDPRALRFVQVDVVDAKGLRDPFAEPKVRFSVTGPGELVAVGNSDEHGTASFRDFKAFPLRFGKALVIVRRTGDGVLTLTAEADGLKSARYDFGGVIRAGAGLQGLKAAQAAVREAKAAQPNEPWTVVVPVGEVRLSETLTFGPEDSGRPGAPIIWKGEGTVVRGGVDLGPWTDEGEGVVSAAIPKDADGKPLALDMLFVNGERASRSVLPKNRGSFKIPGGEADSRAKTLSTNAAGRVTYAKEWTRLNEDAAAVLDAVAPEDLPYVQMQIRLDWTQARRRVVGWDRERREVVTEAFGGKPRDANNRWCARTAIRFENVRAAFVEPGEWFYDAKAGKVLYRLRAGEAATTLRAVAPAKRLSKLLTVDRAHDLRFEGLAFEYADAPQDGVADDPRKFNQTYRSQSAATYDAAVGLRFAERVEFVRCRVARSGNYAFRIADGCRHVALRRCETWDTGAGGVWMGSARQNPPNGELRRAILLPTEPESCAFNVIEDCWFRHGGRFNPEGTAVFVTHASDCRVEHNEIDDWYYSGITVGYTWGYKGSVAQRNRIAYNRISRLGQHELSDMGGIYTLGTSFGTVVCNNVITDVFGYDKSAWGLYADEGSEGIVFENNIISHTEFGGLNQHYGSGCVFRNNIIAYNDERGCLSTSRREFGGVPSRVDIVGNIFYTHKGPLACKGSMEVDGVRAHNVWWKEGGPAADDLDGRSAEEYLASGRAYGDIVADPFFVDAKNGDFRLKPDSPALKLGFREWDHSLAGPRACEVRGATVGAVEFTTPNGGPWTAPDGKEFLTAHPERVMPVGAGDLSAMVSFGADTLHIHFSKTDWFAGDPRWPEIASPGHVAVVFEGLTTNAMTSFLQKMDMERGAIDLKIGTAEGEIAAIIAGDHGTGAMFADVRDARTKRGMVRVGITKGKPCAKYDFTADTVGDVASGAFTVVAAADKATYEKAKGLSFAERERRRLAWWKSYWDRGWVSLKGDERAELLDRLWHVNLYVWASVGYGPIPPKFNGGAGLVHGDTRHWGRNVWYQNTREMIWPMCAANRPEFADAILDMYDTALGVLAEKTAKEYPEFAGLPGVVLRETMEIFDSDRVSGRSTPRPDVRAPYVEPTDEQRAASREKRLRRKAAHISHTYSSGTELLQQMIEYVRFTGDRGKIARVAAWLRAQTELYLTILEKGGDGKWHTHGTNVNESWWIADDSICDLAAARYLFSQTVAHGAEFGFPANLIAAAKERLANLAPYPTLNDVTWVKGKTFMKVESFVPGDKFYAPCAFTNGQQKSNFENNELYLVHPLGMANCFAPGPDRDRALETFRRGPNTGGGYGWTPVGIAAAWMRHENAADVVVGHARNTCRWPYGGGRSPSALLYKGANVEEAPYLDGTGVMQTGVQELLLQSQANEPDASFFTGGVIRLIPCVPKSWSGAFKLRARGGFVVTCAFAKGEVTACEILSEHGNELIYADPKTDEIRRRKTRPGGRIVI